MPSPAQKPTKGCIHRLTQEHRRYIKDPIPNIEAQPDPNNILEWHFVIHGEANTPYEGGTYHGKLLFPPDYPFKPPGILMLTPSGRFLPGQKICFSFSDFHPEAWNPIWHIATILNATQSFMNEESRTAGSTTSTPKERKQLAQQSMDANCKNPAFRRLYPHLVEKHKEKQAEDAATAAAKAEDTSNAHANGAHQEGDAGQPQWLQAAWRAAPPVLIAVMAIGILLVQYLPNR